MAVKNKKAGFGLEMKAFNGKDGNDYIVFRTKAGSFHVFMEVEAKEASRQCGAKQEGTTRQMWQKVWD